MDRQHLHGLGVGLQPPAALLVARVVARPRRSAAAATPSARSCPAARRSRPRAGAGRRGAGRSARRSPSASASTRAGQALDQRDRLGRATRRPARAARAPSRAAGGGPPPTPPRRRHATCSAVQPRNARQRGRARARAATSAARAPRAAAASRAPARVPNTLPAPLITAGTPTASSASRIERGVAVRAHEHGDVAGPHGLAAERRAVVGAALDLGARGQQRDDVGGEVLGDVLARRRRCARSRCVVELDRRRRRGGRPARAAAPRSGAPRSRGARLASAARTVRYDDALVAELGAAEQRVVGVDQPLVAAPVDVERRARAGLARRPRGRRRRRRRGTRRSPASGRRSARASPPSPNARRMMSHWTGSVSWNSSTSTTR